MKELEGLLTFWQGHCAQETDLDLLKHHNLRQNMQYHVVIWNIGFMDSSIVDM